MASQDIVDLLNLELPLSVLVVVGPEAGQAGHQAQGDQLLPVERLWQTKAHDRHSPRRFSVGCFPEFSAWLVLGPSEHLHKLEDLPTVPILEFSVTGFRRIEARFDAEVTMFLEGCVDLVFLPHNKV